MTGSGRLRSPQNTRRFWAVLLLVLVLLPPLPSLSQKHFLVMEAVENAFNNGDFSYLEQALEKKISVYFEAPFQLNGYVRRERFIDYFNRQFTLFEFQRLEWRAKDTSRTLGVQSLNVVLKNKRSEKVVYYKFILFLRKVNEEWLIYYLKGQNI